MDLRSHSKFTISQVKFVLKNHDELHNKEIAEELELDTRQIRSIYRKYGLKKTISLRGKTSLGRYRKGHVPWSRGRSGFKGANKTSFKEGGIPRNYLPVGSISIRKNKKELQSRRFIKTAESNKWEMYTRYLWRIKCGEIPEGYVVRHRDGNWLNDSIENYELITKKENFRKNRNKFYKLN